jgi:hypothetical protein
MCDNKTSELIEILSKIFINNKYDYSKISWDGKTSSRVIVVCREHNYEWNTLVQNLLRGHGCKKCGSQKVSLAKNKSKVFFEKAKDKFSGKFDYSNSKYTKLVEPFTTKCIKHNREFTVKEARHHLESDWGGCPDCNKEYRSGQNHPLVIPKCDFEKKIREIHPENIIFDTSDYITLSSIIKVYCSKHDRKWESTGSNLLSAGRGCQICGYESTGDKLRKSIDTFINEANIIHNNKYTYDNFIYVNNGTPSEVTCKSHGNFLIPPSVHLKGYGCPLCSNARSSKGEVEWIESIIKENGYDIIYKGGKYNRQERFEFDSKKYFTDGFCKETKTVFEFLGCWYHGCPKCFHSEKVHSWNKKKMCDLYEEFIFRKKIFEKNGYNVEYIWECEWNKKQAKEL